MIDDRDDADDRPVDLSPIDPLRDEPRFDAIAQSIVRDAMAAREVRTRVASPYGVVAHIARWSTPILAAAAVIVAVATPLLMRPLLDVSPPSVDVGAPERFGVPASIAALTQSRHDPTPAEVIAAFDVHWRGGGQ